MSDENPEHIPKTKTEVDRGGDSTKPPRKTKVGYSGDDGGLMGQLVRQRQNTIVPFNSTATLFYWPITKQELDAIAESGFMGFPSEGALVSAFNPMTDPKHAIEIAHTWIAQDEAGGGVGYVVKFQLKNSYLGPFLDELRSQPYGEFRVPVDRRVELNENILGRIEVVAKVVQGECVSD
jgi:hypothetical protein